MFRRAYVIISLGLILWCGLGCEAQPSQPPQAPQPSQAAAKPEASKAQASTDQPARALIPPEYKVDHPLAIECEAERRYESCVKVASMLLLGRGLPVSLVSAEAYYKAACDGELAQGCHGWAVVLRDMVKTEEAQIKALALFEDNCARRQYRPSCGSWAAMRAGGEGGAPDEAAAKEAAIKSCESHKDAYSCEVAALLISKRGPGLTPDPTRAASFFERACEGGLSRSCDELAALYEQGRGVSADRERARKLYQRACDQGVKAYGCTGLARMMRMGLGGVRDLEGAYAVDVKACAAGQRLSCMAQVNALLTGQGVGVDVEAARALLKTSCGEGDQGACKRLTLKPFAD